MADIEEKEWTDVEVEMNPKRPGISWKTYYEVHEIARRHVPFSPDSVGWEKCLQVVLDEYVPNSEREQRAYLEEVKSKQKQKAQSETSGETK